MTEIDGYRARVATLRERVAALPRVGWGEQGPLDEATGERWDRGNVLGHVAEMLPYWVDQIRAVLGGAPAIGRDEAGSASRRAGIDGGREAGEGALLAQIDAGLVAVDGLLASMSDADLGRRLTYRASSGEREVDVREGLDEMLIGHTEEHLAQLAELT